MELKWLQTTAEGVVLTIKATPRAGSNAIAGIEAEWLRLRLQAPPVEGRANTELIQWLARQLRIPKSAITIISGSSGRLKRVALRGVTREQVLEWSGLR